MLSRDLGNHRFRKCTGRFGRRVFFLLEKRFAYIVGGMLSCLKQSAGTVFTENNESEPRKTCTFPKFMMTKVSKERLFHAAGQVQPEKITIAH